MKYWQLIARNLRKRGWTLEDVTAPTLDGRVFAVDAHRRDGRHYLVKSDDQLTAFLELESACREVEKQ
jgi:hypothetical protein